MSRTPIGRNPIGRTPIGRTRVGLCLGGGGITGAMYEVGCLAALEDGLADFSAASFDAYVGTASGATVAMVLAGGFGASRLYRALLDPADDFFPLRRNHLMRLDAVEIRRVASSLVRAARHFVSSAASKPLELDVWNELDRFWDSLPAGIFNLDAYEQFLESFMARRQIPSRFAALDRALFIVANDLDRGERAVFGRGHLQHVPIARAVCAASAAPLLFAPVRVGDRDMIEGGMGDVAHADLAERAGCSTILIINPMVPVSTDVGVKDLPTGHGKAHRVRDKGLIWVNSQAWRLRSEAQLRAGLERFRVEHPSTELVLLEPDPRDATLFMHSPMNFAARRAILEHAYRSTAARLNESEPIQTALTRAGLALKKN